MKIKRTPNHAHVTRDGEIVATIPYTASNDDWMRARRLQKSGRTKDQQEFKKLDQTGMSFVERDDCETK